MNKLLTLVFCFSFVFHSLGQNQVLEEIENEMVRIGTGLKNSKEDSQRLILSDSLHMLVTEAVNSAGCFEYPFEKIDFMAVLTSEDQMIRIFNWNVPKSDDSHDFYCFVLKREAKKSELFSWFELTESKKKQDFASIKNKYLKADNWFGALYYEIITLNPKGSKTYYTLLGWNGKDEITNQKVVEVLHFPKKDIRLGAPIFKMEKGVQKRFLMEYAEEVYASLKWDYKEERIVFDHLSPRSQGLSGNYAFYGPDGTYDAFVLEKGKWNFVTNVYVTLSKEDSKRPYVQPRGR